MADCAVNAVSDCLVPVNGVYGVDGVDVLQVAA